MPKGKMEPVARRKEREKIIDEEQPQGIPAETQPPVQGKLPNELDELESQLRDIESQLEKIESLEQLRVLWQGEKIHVDVAKVRLPVEGVDTPEDLEKARQFAKSL